MKTFSVSNCRLSEITPKIRTTGALIFKQEWKGTHILSK